MIYSRPWTNLILLMAIKMVLCGAGAGAGDVLTNASRVRQTPEQHHPHRVLADEEIGEPFSWKRSHWKEMNSILRQEGSSKNGVECCPSVVEMVAPKGGRDSDGRYVELYRDGENQQQLYELSCAKGVVDKPCRFIETRFYNQSKCVQRYSYSYALVRSPAAATASPHRHRREGKFPVPGGWAMDYVRVRAGCECEVTPPKRKGGHRSRQEHRHKRKNRSTTYEAEEDDT